MSQENAQYSPAQKPQLNIARLVFDLIILALVVALPVRWSFDYYLPTLTGVGWKGGEKEWMANLRSWDQIALQAADQPPGSGNVAWILTNFDKGNSYQAQYAQEMLVRGSYSLYPRRLWVAPDGKVLNGGPDVIDAQFQPSIEWLLAHGVHGVVNAVGGPGEQISTNITILKKDPEK